MCGHRFLHQRLVFADVIFIREAEFTTNSMSYSWRLLGGATCREALLAFTRIADDRHADDQPGKFARLGCILEESHMTTDAPTGATGSTEALLSFWGEPFMAKSTERNVPRYIPLKLNEYLRILCQRQKTRRCKVQWEIGVKKHERLPRMQAVARSVRSANCCGKQGKGVPSCTISLGKTQTPHALQVHVAYRVNRGDRI